MLTLPRSSDLHIQNIAVHDECHSAHLPSPLERTTAPALSRLAISPQRDVSPNLVVDLCGYSPNPTSLVASAKSLLFMLFPAVNGS
jgi:hypothetical protein